MLNELELGSNHQHFSEPNTQSSLPVVVPSIADRFVDPYEIRLMKSLPPVNYEFCVISDADEERQLNKIYIQQENEKFYYKTLLSGHDRQEIIVDDFLNADIEEKRAKYLLNTVLTPESLATLEPAYKADILTVLEKKKHVFSINTLTVITSDGLFQFNQELNQMKCLLDKDWFYQHHLTVFTEQANNAPTQGTLIHDALTIENLLLLENASIAVRGHTIIGYTINERIFCYLIGYHYPPSPDAYSKRWLNLMHRPMVNDVLLALKVTFYSVLVFAPSFVHDTAFKNLTWYYLSILGFFAINLLLLRGNCLPKKPWSSILNCGIQIEKNIIVVITLWFPLIAYSNLASRKDPVETYGLIPLLILAIIRGIDSYRLSNVSMFNIFNRPRYNILLNGCCYGLMTSALFSLGVDIPIYFSCVMTHRTDDDNFGNHTQCRMFTQNIKNIIEVSIFPILFLAHLMRYPYTTLSTQTMGRYVSNVMNAMGNVLLNTYLYSSISFIFITDLFLLLQLPYNWPLAEDLIFIYLQPLVFLGSFLTSFPNTLNLPELSIEPLPPEKTWCETTFEYIERAKQALQCFKNLCPKITFFEQQPITENDKNNASHTTVSNPIFKNAQQNLELDHGF